MEIRVSIWNNTKVRILGVETFTSPKELQDFMKIIREVEPKASYNVMEVKK
jgi:hypothetical protein